MRKSILAVCDLEIAYAYNLMEYIHKKKGTMFEVQAFTSVQCLCRYAKEQDIGILLISENAMCEEVKELPIEKIMILSEGEVLEELSGYPSIYKYQPSDMLIAEVMEQYAVSDIPKPGLILKQKMKIYGVYSPISRVLKTSFSLTLGQVLAKHSGVLYLNLEAYSGLAEMLGKEFRGDITDLMYFVREECGNPIFKMAGLVEHIGNLDMVPPAFSFEDLQSIRFEEWQRLLEEIAKYSSYDVVILDLSEHVQGLFDLMHLCDRIYMPVREDAIAIGKLEQYEKLLTQRGYEDVIEKTRKLKLPYHCGFGAKENYIEQLIWGELGDYVRNLVRED